MRLAKRVGWGISLKRGERIKWMRSRLGSWFGTTGMFRQYKKVNAERLSKFITDLLSQSLSHPRGHSADETGALDEDIPPYVLLCREYQL